MWHGTKIWKKYFFVFIAFSSAINNILCTIFWWHLRHIFCNFTSFKYYFLAKCLYCCNHISLLCFWYFYWILIIRLGFPCHGPVWYDLDYFNSSRSICLHLLYAISLFTLPIFPKSLWCILLLTLSVGQIFLFLAFIILR